MTKRPATRTLCIKQSSVVLVISRLSNYIFMAKATNADKIAALTAAGVALTGKEKAADLDKLIADNNVTVAPAKADEDQVEDEPVTLESLDARLKKVELAVSGGNKGVATHLNTPAVGITPVTFDPKVKPAESSVTFKVNDSATPVRTFSADEHGEDFNDVANEFHKSNENKIISREHDVAGAQ